MQANTNRTLIIEEMFKSHVKMDPVFLKKIKNTNVFVIHGKLSDFDSKFNYKEMLQGEQKLDASEVCLPFEDCFFELIEPLVMVGLPIVVRAVHIQEICPGHIKTSLILHSAQGHIKTIPLDINFKDITATPSRKLVSDYDIETKEKAEMLFGFYVKVILSLVDNSKEYGITKPEMHLKSGYGLKASKMHINKLIHLRPKSENSFKYFKGVIVDWSHRWKVRGHWRKVDFVGKDRYGNYTQKGFTWVVDHIKGPEDQPLIDKIRLMKTPNYQNSVEV